MGKRKGPKHKQDNPRKAAPIQEPPKRKKWWTLLLEIVGAIGVIVTILAFVLSALPKLSVDVSGSLQPTSPMGTVFYLSNDGALPIHDVVVTCSNLEIEGQNLRVTGLGAEFPAPPEARADILSPGHKMTLPYAPAFGFTAISNFTGTRLIIKAHYRPDYIPWHETATFPFEAIRTANGSWIWKSIPR